MFSNVQGTRFIVKYGSSSCYVVLWAVVCYSLTRYSCCTVKFFAIKLMLSCYRLIHWCVSSGTYLCFWLLKQKVMCTTIYILFHVQDGLWTTHALVAWGHPLLWQGDACLALPLSVFPSLGWFRYQNQLHSRTKTVSADVSSFQHQVSARRSRIRLS